MKKLLVGSLYVLASITLLNCKEDEVEAIDTRFEAELVGMNNMEIIIDTETNLVWVNDIRACFAGIINPEMECGMLTFAGRDDWRTPTPAEMSELLTEIAKRKMNLNYINATCGLMSTTENVWVFTENTDMPGVTTTAMPGNAGLRCVTMAN